MEEETEYLLFGIDKYGANCVRREISRENLEREIADFCEIEDVHYRDVTVCEVIKADIALTVRLPTD